MELIGFILFCLVGVLITTVTVEVHSKLYEIKMNKYYEERAKNRRNKTI